ncbi:MAG TPA: NAD(P)-dependent oxidoreductase [Gammaproteobacteria bacterium]|nr:NAD(P)-dependent oxidoreductase [Gammaproteobacteria bacterium]
MKDIKVAITGGAGRLGRCVAAKLFKTCELTIVDKHDDITGERMPIDVLDREMLATAIAGQDAIIHLAAIDASINASEHEFYETNTLAAWNVLGLGYSAGVRQFVICSSSSVYGFSQSNRLGAPEALPIDELHSCRPSSAYGLSKQVTEIIAEGFSRRPDMSVTVLRPCYVAFDNLLEQMCSEREARNQLTQAVAGQTECKWIEPLPVLRSWIDPESVADCFRRALEAKLAGFHVFNVNSDDTFIKDDTLPYMKAVFGELPKRIDQEFYVQNPRGSIFDNRLAFKSLGWKPRADWHNFLHQAR